MKNAYPELEKALLEIVSKLDESLKEGNYRGEPVKMYLAGGVAVNYYCGSRYTEDVDATFSKKMILPKDLATEYVKQDGNKSFLYFDTQYNDTFGLLHEDYQQESQSWEGQNSSRIQLMVLAPVDLAISKLGRLQQHDMDDVLQLSSLKLFTVEQFRERAFEALTGFIGSETVIRGSINLASEKIVEQELRLAGKHVENRKDNQICSGTVLHSFNGRIWQSIELGKVAIHTVGTEVSDQFHVGENLEIKYKNGSIQKITPKDVQNSRG